MSLHSRQRLNFSTTAIAEVVGEPVAADFVRVARLCSGASPSKGTGTGAKASLTPTGAATANGASSFGVVMFAFGAAIMVM